MIWRQSTEQVLSTFDISPHNGFLPSQLPLTVLPDAYYEPWETLIGGLSGLLQRQQLVPAIHSLPILNTSRLKSEREWQRAYVILSFVTHAYIWGADRPSEILPPQITVPYLQVARHLDLPPTATYAALNLWNFAPASSLSELSVPENLRSLTTFTGTSDEAWFYLISVAMESKGAEAIPLALRCAEAISQESPERLPKILQGIAQCIDEIGTLLERMYERCDPNVFYHQIRPFLAGSKGMAVAGLPQGVFYDEGEGKGRYHTYSGGSNAQSSLIQFLDLVLGTEHHSTGAPSSKPSPSKATGNPYIAEMRNYMPLPHRNFLSQIPQLLDLRTYATAATTPTIVREAYDRAVTSLTTFRNKHLTLVTRYIIIPSRQQSSSSSALGKSGVEEKVNLATVSRIDTQESRDATFEAKAPVSEHEPQLQGTGGMDLMSFLKQTRDETVEAKIGT
ncbi:putative indoleaminedioxygenase pyrroledioxygenase [Phaeomoniella chlamydospora]|uniref:Indoleamine 2,3-dioxygenase n=1 Tax=Phaeomoniella chlamydospora TaxID=158046 RepID=A0A0G2ETG5_PHACM|nr:putative indoleaminedioxygenase pyrroledioxygenase [Phaeomoniella chlamydospora]